MRLGLLPSQKRELRKAFKKADKFDHFRQRTRRQFMAIGALGVATGIGGFFVGRTFGLRTRELPPADESRRRWLQKLPWARTYAEQPAASLSTNYATFLMVIQQTGGDDPTWRGFAKLVEHALSPSCEDPYLRRALLRTCESAPPPDWLQPAVQRLAAGQ